MTLVVGSFQDDLLFLVDGVDLNIYGSLVQQTRGISFQLHLTAWELKRLGIIDEIIPEPGEGAHAEPESATAPVKQYLCQGLAGLNEAPTPQLLEARYGKYRLIGQFRSQRISRIGSKADLSLYAKYRTE